MMKTIFCILAVVGFIGTMTVEAVAQEEAAQCAELQEIAGIRTPPGCDQLEAYCPDGNCAFLTASVVDRNAKTAYDPKKAADAKAAGRDSAQ